MIPLMEWRAPRFADTRRTDRVDWPTQREITPDSLRLRPIRRTRWWEYHWVSKNAPKGIRTDKSYDGLMGGRFHLISPHLNKLWRSKHAPNNSPLANNKVRSVHWTIQGRGPTGLVRLQQSLPELIPLWIKSKSTVRTWLQPGKPENAAINIVSGEGIWLYWCLITE